MIALLRPLKSRVNRQPPFGFRTRLTCDHAVAFDDCITPKERYSSNMAHKLSCFSGETKRLGSLLADLYHSLVSNSKCNGVT